MLLRDFMVEDLEKVLTALTSKEEALEFISKLDNVGEDGEIIGGETEHFVCADIRKDYIQVDFRIYDEHGNFEIVTEVSPKGKEYFNYRLNIESAGCHLCEYKEPWRDDWIDNYIREIYWGD